MVGFKTQTWAQDWSLSSNFPAKISDAPNIPIQIRHPTSSKHLFLLSILVECEIMRAFDSTQFLKMIHWTAGWGVDPNYRLTSASLTMSYEIGSQCLGHISIQRLMAAALLQDTNSNDSYLRCLSYLKNEPESRRRRNISYSSILHVSWNQRLGYWWPQRDLWLQWGLKGEEAHAGQMGLWSCLILDRLELQSHRIIIT